MCGRYRRTTAEEELARRYHIPIPSQRDLPISWNIVPSQDVLAIRFNPETKQRSFEVGIDSVLGQRSEDWLQNDQRENGVRRSAVVSGSLQETQISDRVNSIISYAHLRH